MNRGEYEASMNDGWLPPPWSSVRNAAGTNPFVRAFLAAERARVALWGDEAPRVAASIYEGFEVGEAPDRLCVGPMMDELLQTLAFYTEHIPTPYASQPVRREKPARPAAKSPPGPSDLLPG